MAEATLEKKQEEKPAATRFVAKLRYARVAPRKLRLVVDLIRGKDYNTALAFLRTCPKRGAYLCIKLLKSAFANASYMIREHPETYRELDPDSLHLVEARVDGGPILKRWRPSSMRRPTMIRKRTSHVLFVLEPRERKLSRAERRAQKKQEQAQREKAQKVKETKQPKEASEVEGKSETPPAPPSKE